MCVLGSPIIKTHRPPSERKPASKVNHKKCEERKKKSKKHKKDIKISHQSKNRDKMKSGLENFDDKGTGFVNNKNAKQIAINRIYMSRSRRLNKTILVDEPEKARDNSLGNIIKSKNISDHTDNDKEIFQSDSTNVNDAAVKTNLYSCDTCRKCFKSKFYLGKHICVHSGEKQCPGDIGTKCFKVKSNFDVHIRTHTNNKQYQCIICKKYFSKKSNLDDHIRTHTGEKPFQCSVCKKCFSKKSNLRDHFRIHTGEKPYQCYVCKKCFIRRSDLRNHIRVHTVEKPYQCNQCKKHFKQLGHLNEHIRIHSGEKP